MDVIIDIRWDDEASVYTAICPEIGLFLESESYDKLKDRIVVAAPEIASENNIMINSILLKSEQSLAVPA